MIQRVASILKDRIAAFTYVDKVGGLVRVARQQREGAEIVIPVAGDVADAYACDPQTVRDMVPDEAYACMVYFEDRGTTREVSRTRGTSYRASLRLVCWVNTAKFSGDPGAAERILEQFVNDLNVGQPYNSDTLIGIKHQVEGMPIRGASIFGQYTYPEAARQYLLWPFDAFALDINATYRIRPGCEEAPVPGDDSCWTPPTTKKRRNPTEFTCEELTDPVTGLTPTQLGPDCLDCQGTAPCDPTTVNGTESDTPTITVVQGGVEVGTLNPATGVHTVPECEECDPFTATLNGVEIINEADPCGASVALECADAVDAVVVEGAEETQKNGTYLPSADVNGRTSYELAPNHVIEWTGTQYQLRDIFTGPDWVTTNAPSTPWGGVWVTVSGGDPIVGTVRQATIADLCPCSACDPATWTLKDEADNVLDSGAIASGGAADIVAYNVSVQLRDSAANNIGSPNVYLSGSTNNLTAPDGTVTIQNSVPTTLHTVSVRSNGAATQAIADSSITRPDGTTIGLPATVALDVRSYRSGIAYNFGRILHSGQTTVYQAGDEGTMYADGFFTYVRPVYPTHYAELGANFMTLAANNVWGNTLRFTDRAGNAAATTGNRIIQDHFTGIEWYVPGTPFTAATWVNAIDAAQAFNDGTYADWYLPNDRCLDSITRDDQTQPLNYGPFLLAIDLWTSSTDPTTTTSARRCIASGNGNFASNPKTATNGYIYCRKFI